MAEEKFLMKLIIDESGDMIFQFNSPHPGNVIDIYPHQKMIVEILNMLTPSGKEEFEDIDIDKIHLKERILEAHNVSIIKTARVKKREVKQ